MKRGLFSILNFAFCLLLAACSSAPPPATPTTAPAATAAPTDFGNGGTLIMTLGARDPESLDPALSGNIANIFLVRQLFSGLTRLDTSLQAQPDLAESWQISPDGTTYTFTLRADARFADGTPLTAADVVYSLERACDPKLTASPPAATYLSDIVGVREKLAGQADTIAGLSAPDDRTVTIQIDAPKSYFLAKLSFPTSFVVDRRTVEADPKSWIESPNGSGPFAIERWDHDKLLVIKRNLSYYRPVPKLDRVRFLIGAAASNPMLLYEQGDIDVTGVPAYALARVEDSNNPLSKELLRVPELSTYYVAMNVNLPPFDDPKVRQAFGLLFDRQKMVEVSLDGAAEVARGILPPGLPGYNPDLPEPQTDLARARQLLAESRYGGAAGLPPIVAYGGWAGSLREIAREELGIEIEVRGYEEYSDYVAALNQGQFQIFDSGWIADYPDPENFLAILFRGGSAENHTGYDSPAVNDLLDRAAVEKDEAARFELYRQAERQILADAPVSPLYHGISYTLVKPYVRGLDVTPMGILDLSTVELAR